MRDTQHDPAQQGSGEQKTADPRTTTDSTTPGSSHEGAHAEGAPRTATVSRSRARAVLAERFEPPADPRRGGLSREERQSRTAELLAAAAQLEGDERERVVQRVVVINMCVATSLAARHRGKGIPQEDLEQVAYLALVRAARQFDCSRDRDFLTYAVPTIRGELRKHFRDCGWIVRPPRRVQEIQSRAVAARDTLIPSTGRTPTDEEIAQALGEDPRDVREALAAEGCFHATSLDVPLGDGGGATLADLRGEDDPGAAAAEARLVLGPALAGLSERDKRILALRFYEDRTQQEIAEDIGVTQMQVSRLLSRIMRQMREQIEDERAERRPVREPRRTPVDG